MGATSHGSVRVEGGKYERAEAGVYPARCIQVVELGQQEVTFKGETKIAKQLMIVWELSELMQDGRPFVVSWKGTNSLNEKSALFKMLSSWRGRPFTNEELAKFELKNILDKECMVNVTKETAASGKDYNKVVSVMPMPKGMKCEPRVNDLVDFGIDDYPSGDFDKLYPYVKDIILKSKEVMKRERDNEIASEPNEAF